MVSARTVPAAGSPWCRSDSRDRTTDAYRLHRIRAGSGEQHVPDVLRARIDEDIDIFGEAWFRMKRDSVVANDVRMYPRGNYASLRARMGEHGDL